MIPFSLIIIYLVKCVIKNLKIPKARIPVLIGKENETIKTIEEKTRTKINVEKEITIEGESIDILVAENIVKAIARGFSPENAFLLLDENYVLSVIPLSKDRKKLKRVKARLIGTGGKCRKIMETATNTKISIYGKTISIIGRSDDVFTVQTAVKKLISGAGHITVYKFLGVCDGEEKNRRGDGKRTKRD